MGSLPMLLSHVPGDTEPSLLHSHNVLVLSNEDSQAQDSEEMHSEETESIQDLSSAVMLLLLYKQLCQTFLCIQFRDKSHPVL